MLDWLRTALWLRRKSETGARRAFVSLSSTNMTDDDGIAKELSPDGLLDYLNRYISTNHRLIEGNGGHLDCLRPSPDAMPAYWEAGGNPEETARSACESAIKQLAAMNEFRAWAASHGYPPAQIRIGIHSGEVIIGRAGRVAPDGYMIIGEAVNTAVRLSRIASELGCGILVSESTRNLVTELRFGEPIRLHRAGRASGAAPQRAFPLLGREDADLRNSTEPVGERP